LLLLSCLLQQVAHTSQFTTPGKCKYLENAAVGVGTGGGWLNDFNSSSIVVLVCPAHITAVIETMGAKASTAVTLALNNVPSAGLDEGLLSYSLPSLVYMENPYTL
jgi:hypothetical protein